jgi:ABC-type ATPase with predicted acetyltransferase domain
VSDSYSISKSFKWQGTITEKVAAVCRMFGLTVDRLKEKSVRHHCKLEISDGDIVYITGPSGAGKTVLMHELGKLIPACDSVNLEEIELPSDKTLVDCIDDDSLIGTLRLLSIAGLNDCFCILNQPSNLSAGQKYRFRLAMALASRKKFIFADEFCSELDRITAAVISCNLHKFAKRNHTTFILASSHDDILRDLSPDVLVVKDMTGSTDVIYKSAMRK